MKVIQEVVFTGANKQNYIADYNPSRNLVAYGAGHNVALWNPVDPHHKGTFHTLKNHTKEITTVKFVPNSPYLISTSEDETISIWKEEHDKYVLHQTLNDHEHSITCITVVNEKFFITGSADNNIILWVYQQGQYVMKEKFQIKSNFYPLCLAVQNVENGNYILAIGGTTNNLYIYTFNLDSFTQVTKVAELTGHEDWIKCLQFVKEANDNYILASASQDRYVRLWRLKLNDSIDDSDEDSSKLILLSNKQYKFEFNGQRGAFSFEALIMGHDDWVNGIQWHPSYHYGSSEKKLQLLTCTADTALMVWEMDIDSGIWVCVNRLGEMSIKGASTATGASGGFWSCLWFIHDNQQYILASGKTGSFRVYKSKDGVNYENSLGVTGPTRDVTDVVWSKNGDYFMATSLDQTTRLFAPWKRNGIETWHEIARPQIHGYDMICYDNISNTKFVSGGDEKILRVFEMTKSISQLLKKLCDIDIKSEEVLPEAASLPVLGLSNKAESQITEGGIENDQEEHENEEEVDILSTLDCPPVEEYLQRFTLFPEVEKLYGHGYEINCCATSPDGKLIATACRSNSVKHAVIRIFNVSKDYQQSPQVLQGHNLTISSLKFSSDGKYLLAVSRDRQFSLWKLVNEEQFELVELNPKPHSRILWDCEWIPNQPMFITVSRDKLMKLWKIGSRVELVTSEKLNEPITSISVYKNLINNSCIIAVGLEDGDIQIFKLDLETDSFTLISKFSNDITPSERIEKLAFSNRENELALAVGSKDTSIRLYSISI